MDSHPIHFHGHVGYLTGTDGGPIPRGAWEPLATVNVPVGSTRDVEFVADNPGDWPLHCHKTHHTMNAMNHEVANLTGVDLKTVGPQFERISPGAMLMGETGMAGMSEHHMDNGVPNTVPMMAGKGRFGPI